MKAAAVSLVALSGAAAFAACRGTPGSLLVRRLNLRTADRQTIPGPWRRFMSRGRLAAALAVALAVVAAAAVMVVLGPQSLLLSLTAVAAAFAAVRLRAMSASRRDAEQMRGRVVEMCDALAAEMRAGQPAGQALSRAADEHPALRSAARAATMGGSVSDALRASARRPGAAGLAMLAAAWQVAERSGAGLAVTLDRVATALRAEDAARVEVSASLGPPRATARLLALLPVFGLMLGAGIGGNPVTFLIGSLAGNVCLAVGTALALLGIWWVERLAAGAES